MLLKSQSVANIIALIFQYVLNETIFQTYSFTDYPDRSYFYHQGRARGQDPLSRAKTNRHASGL